MKRRQPKHRHRLHGCFRAQALIEICLSFAVFSIDMLGFYTLMQLFRELHYNCSHQKHFFSPKCTKCRSTARLYLEWLASLRAAHVLLTPLAVAGVGRIKEGRERRRGEESSREGQGGRKGRKGKRQLCIHKSFQKLVPVSLHFITRYAVAYSEG